MATFFVLVCSCTCFLATTAFYSFVYLPIKNKRSKRRVNQDAHALPPSSSSPFVEVDAHEVRRIMQSHSSQNRSQKNSIDITTIPRPSYMAVPVTSNMLFRPARIIV
ncbi:hypothetical protein LY90DRAFT_701534, partial [Neocallimastix californiae]